MRTPRLAPTATTAAILSLLLTVTGCSSGHDSNPVAGTSRVTTSTEAGTTTSTRSTATSGSSVRIVSMTGPRSPVQCNAPTSFDLHFETQHAASVTLRINGGPVFATYTGTGVDTEEVPLACDGSSQTYLLTARAANGETATKSLTLETRVSM